ncbi:uncharacterized protein LOC135343935 isoform X2 [Halichondria panicea]|uniref:uncharacterized protein LOC135343935 isoform X2 n=1 Tax=Halichondria panicea TaxID=6063 RepID=UPI00312B5205
MATCRSADFDRGHGLLDTKLKIDDHLTVYERLFNADTRWYNIGLKLKVPNEKLKNIREVNRNDSERCLCEMIDYCIKSDDGLTWKKVCDSLRSPIVKCNQIAEDIEEWLLIQQKVSRDTDETLNQESHVTHESTSESENFSELGTDVPPATSLPIPGSAGPAGPAIPPAASLPTSGSAGTTPSPGLTCTVEFLQTTMNITDEQLNLNIQETYLYELAACFDNTDDYVEILGLSDAQQTDVKEEKAKVVINRTQAGMKLALKYWLRKEHLEATFRSLLSLILSMNKGNVAGEVCEFLKNLQLPKRKRKNSDYSMQSGSIGTSKQRRKSDATVEELDLLKEDFSMERSFNNLSNQIRKSLVDQGHKPTQLLSCLQGYDMFPKLLVESNTIFAEEKERCMKCESINDLWFYIGNFFTSYSYEILETLIQELGTETDKQRLQDYKKLFFEHSKKSLENFGAALTRFTGTTYRELIVKINDTFKKISAKHLEELKINLAKAVDIPNNHLKRFIVQPGCIEITYHVPLYVEFQLKAFSISSEQRTLLENLRVIWLKCGCFWYYVQNVDGSGSGNNQRRPDTDGDRSSDARKKFISNINPDNVVDTDSVYEQLDKASSIHDSESGYGTGYGTMGKDYTYGKLPARKQPEEKIDQLGRLDTIETSQMKTFPDATKAQIDTSRLLKRYTACVPKRNDNNTQLHIACYNGDVLKVSECIQVQKLDPLEFNQQGDTALHTATRAGHLNVVKYLVEECQVNEACEAADGSTAFHIAAFYGHKHLVKYFNEKELDPLYCNEYKETPLFLACLAGDVQIVKLLVKEAQKYQPVEDFIRNTTLTGETVLHYAVLSKKLAMVKYLVTILQTERLERGVRYDTAQHRFALLDEADRNGRMPIHLACQCGLTDIVQYLVESETYKPDICTSNGCTPLHYAALSETPCVLEYLIKEHHCDAMCTDILNNTPVHYAAIGGTLETFKCLIETHRCDSNVLNIQKESPLHMACENGQIIIAKYLIEDEKYNQYSKASRGNTPLHFAAFGGHYDLVKYLIIDRECDPNTKNDDNETPLFFASYGEKVLALLVGDDVFHHIKNPPRFMKTIKFLVEEHNCCLTLSNPGKFSPLQIACFYDNITAVQYYIEDQKCDKESKDANGMALIHVAALGDAIDVFTYLVETQQVDINSSDNNGNTPLHYAADTRGKESLKTDLYKSVIKTPTKLSFHQKTGLKNIFTDMNQIEHQLNLSVLRYLMSGVTSISELTNSKGQTPLHIACKRGQLSTVKLFSDFELETKDKEGATPLHLAAQCGHLPVVEYLALEKKCDIKCIDNDNDTPAHLATISGHLDVIKFFVETMGFDILADSSQESHDVKFVRFPLHVACAAENIDVVRYLVEEFRCDVMTRDEDGDVPLHHAAMLKNITTIKYLVEECDCNVLVTNEKGLTPLHYSVVSNIDIVQYFVEECECDVRVKTKDGLTPLHLAVIVGNIDVAKYFISKNSDLLHSRDNNGCTPLHMAAMYGKVEMCKLLISDFYCDKNEIAENGQTPLHFAASDGHLPVVEYLTLEVNCDKSSTDVDGFTPAHLAVLNGHLDVLKFFVERLTFDIRNEKALDNNIRPIHLVVAKNGNLAILKYLVEECKCDVMVKDSHDRVPLHYAAILGQLETVRYLIEKCECDAMVKDSDGMLPLDYSTANKTTEIMRYLVEECQCPLNSMNKTGQVLLHHAAGCGNIEAIVYLTSKTTDDLPRDVLDLTPVHYAVLNESLPIVTYYVSYLKCDPNIPCLSDTTLLQLACSGGHLDIVQFLQQCPACDFQESDRSGKTPLHYALGAEQMEISHFLVNLKLCDVTASDKAGNTCLHIAAEHGLLEFVQLFVDDFDCNPNSLNARRLTPFHVACENGHEEVMKYLTSHHKFTPVTNNDNFTTLYFIVLNNNIEKAKELALSSEYDLKSRDQDGKTILHYAVKTLRREFIEFLIFEIGCDVTIADNEGNTCLHIAAELGQLELVQMFVMAYGLNINRQNSVGLTPLHLAACNGYEGVAKFLLEQPNCDVMRKDNDNRTPLHHAIMVESLEIVQMFLMDKRTKINIKEDKGNSLLHTLASQCSPDSDLSIMRLLLAFGANPTAVNIFNETPLHVACIHGHEEVADVIISHMDPCSLTTELDCSKATPLHHAALGGNLNIVKFLMSNGYNPMQKDCQGNTALHYAAINGNINILRHLIVDSDLEPNCTNENGYTPAHAACSGASLCIARHLLWSATATETDLYNAVCFLGSEMITLNQNLKTNTGENILHSASRSGYQSIVGYLIIVLKFDPRITNQVGCTPLDIAIGYRQLDVIPFLKEFTPANAIQLSPSALHLAALLGHISSVQYYITDLQSDPDLPDSIGRTPLHYAVMGRRQAIARFLIRSKADHLSEDVFHNLPLHYAAALGYFDLVRFLVNIGSPTTTRGVLGKTLAEMAMDGGHTNVVEFLSSLPDSRKTPHNSLIDSLD